jgi:hypothetical protein
MLTDLLNPVVSLSSSALILLIVCRRRQASVLKLLDNKKAFIYECIYNLPNESTRGLHGSSIAARDPTLCNKPRTVVRQKRKESLEA